MDRLRDEAKEWGGIKDESPPQPPAHSSTAAAPAVSTTPSKPDVSLITLGSASNSSAASSQSKPSTSTSKPAVTTTELDKKTTMITTLFDKISKKGKSYKEKNLKTFDSETLKEIIQIMDVIKDLKDAKIDMGSILTPIANSFGMTTGEVMKQVTRIAEKPAEKSVEKPKKLVLDDLKDLKFTKSDLPHMGEPEIQLMTSIVGSWRTKKQLTNSTITGWLKEVNEKKMTTDDARVSFYSLINRLPDVGGSSPQDGLIEEEKSDDVDVIIPEMLQRKKKIDKKPGEKPTTSGTVTSSDSEPEERPRMTGAPPSKRFRPTAPVKETTPPPGIRAIDSPVVAIKKKAPAPESSTSSSSDIICLDDEPPVKKKAPEVVVKKSEAKILNMSTKTSSAKKICNQQEEMKKI